jgi:hypothetical protein
MFQTIAIARSQYRGGNPQTRAFDEQGAQHASQSSHGAGGGRADHSGRFCTSSGHIVELAAHLRLGATRGRGRRE